MNFGRTDTSALGSPLRARAAIALMNHLPMEAGR
jgi:hypothetical protein